VPPETPALRTDRILTARALTNLVGNVVATLVVARWDNALDEPRAHALLNGTAVIDEES